MFSSPTPLTRCRRIVAEPGRVSCFNMLTQPDLQRQEAVVAEYRSWPGTTRSWEHWPAGSSKDNGGLEDGDAARRRQQQQWRRMQVQAHREQGSRRGGVSTKYMRPTHLPRRQLARQRFPEDKILMKKDPQAVRNNGIVTNASPAVLPVWLSRQPFRKLLAQHCDGWVMESGNLLVA
ncbi:hypothetical protein FA95DRAFT_1572313 [Auriscalpium vulgare]|uniref:Uncharacterized protein n=1 Tax=Auriscalpium vulgare TaxID=40419 RepID=A0ACB8RUH8_9AGAM|nr:hypothetical protein FA95DRAFT_1572313 [Auriscalpium vulgare]